jgi:hypothetical protein
MAPLQTPQEVIAATGVAQLARYEDVGVLDGSVGFFAWRRYPAESRLARVVTQTGAQDVRCLVQFSLRHPDRPITPLGVSATMLSKWRQSHFFQTYDFTQPDCPTPESVRLLRRTWKPLALNFTTEFFYDAGDGRFYNDEGPVTGEQILDYVYAYHYRTLRLRFRVKWIMLQAVRAVTSKVIWRGQDLCLWILENSYDIVTAVPPMKRVFHRYRFADFKRAAPTGPSHFFGLQSSPRSLFPNLLVLLTGCVVVYWRLRHVGLVRAIYQNAVLTTVMVVFLYLLIDKTVPLLLQGATVGLSRLRAWALFLVRQVKV